MTQHTGVTRQRWNSQTFLSIILCIMRPDVSGRVSIINLNYAARSITHHLNAMTRGALHLLLLFLSAAAGLQEFCRCTRKLDPVCGADGVSYNSPCLATCRHRTSVACRGRCPCSGEGSGAPPPTGRATRLDTVAGKCPRQIQPVCGENGRDYMNECLARWNKTRVACRVPCPCTSQQEQYQTLLNFHHWIIISSPP